jgi:DNA-binding NarL/FixJ family response regulator
VSAYFDPTDKKNKPILDYFENKSWLVIEGSTSVRGSIKKTIIQLGSKMSNLSDSDNVTDAQEFIETNKPNFIITNKNVKGSSSLTLFDTHMRHVPNRNNASFFIITEENSLSEVAWVLEYEMDGIISLPLNGAILIQTILSGVARKISPTPYSKRIEDARILYSNNKLDEAILLLKSALSLDAHPYEAHAFIGQIYTEQNLTKSAIDSYEESISHNPKYYKALNRLSSFYYQQKEYKKAYDIYLKLAQTYPLPPEKIPVLIRLSIINKKYEDIINYLKFFQTISTPNAKTQNYLSAGLAILGKHFYTINDFDRGTDALKTAFQFSNGKYEILKSIMQTFEEAKKAEILFDLFDKTDLSVWPKEVQILYFHSLHLTSTDDFRVVSEGEKHIKNGIADPLIFRAIITRSITMKRKSSYIENLILESNKLFPECTEEFENLLKNM